VRSHLEAPLEATLRHDERCSTSNPSCSRHPRGIVGGAPEEGGLDWSATEEVLVTPGSRSEAARPKGVSRGSHHPGTAGGSARERERGQCSSRGHERQTSKEWLPIGWPSATASSAITTSSAVRTRPQPDGGGVVLRRRQGRRGGLVGTRLNTRSFARWAPRVGATSARRGEGRAPQGIDLHRLAGTGGPERDQPCQGDPASSASGHLPHVAHRNGASLQAGGRPIRAARRRVATKACALGAPMGSRVCRRSQDFTSYAPASSTPCGGTGRQERSASAPLRRESGHRLRARKARSPRLIQPTAPRRRGPLDSSSGR
jgi:hypothetical protein